MSIGFIVTGVIVAIVGIAVRFLFGTLAEGESAVEIDLRRKDKDSLDGWEMQQLANASIDAQLHRGRADTANLFSLIGIVLALIGVSIILFR
jgi:hypothetical protein